MTYTIKDCVALTDSDFDAMTQLCRKGPNPDYCALLPEEAENWVLIGMAHEGQALRGFSFFTLDRIGGTPSIIVGLSLVASFSKRKTVMRGLTIEQFKRALISFPHEDVIVGARVDGISAYDIFWQMHDIIPRPDYDPNGEDRQWGKRFAKRFGVHDSAYHQREFRISGQGDPSPVWCYMSGDKTDTGETGGAGCSISRKDLKRLFENVDCTQGDSLIVHGWVRQEDLVKFQN